MLFLFEINLYYRKRGKTLTINTTSILKSASAFLTGGSIVACSNNIAEASTKITVKEGQSLNSIAIDNHIDTNTLAKENGLTVNSTIHPNQILTISDDKKDNYYTVKAGDTVSEIATSRNLDTNTVLKLNGLTWKHSTIYVGQKLKLFENSDTNASTQQNRIVNTPTSSQNTSLHIQDYNIANKAVNLATQLSQQGIPYVWGGESTSGMDCSGLVKYIYERLGYNLPHNTVMQEKYVTKINTPSPQQVINTAHPGDLLFWGQQGASYHVAIYIGNGKYVQAPTYGQNVSVSNVYSFCPNFIGILK